MAGIPTKSPHSITGMGNRQALEIRQVLSPRNDRTNFDVIVIGQHLIFSYQLVPSNHQVCFSQKV
jgi:hypothetical protein